ncbi:MAG: response regulator transcription factor [Sphingobacteriales bacterium]|jgi:two-component system LytT family response regulator|nr:response regulator transcription factor [Sphingobacteriales bacterium]
MKLLITDNEYHIRSATRELLLAFCPEITRIDEATGVEDGLKKIKNDPPDILLLDVEMDDGTGFDLLKQIQNPEFQLIFVTAHNQYAVQAFKFSAIDYLLKPIDPDELRTAISKAASRKRNNDLKAQIRIMMEQLSNKMDPDKKIVLKDHSATYFIKVTDILFCEADGTYTKFYLSPEKVIVVSKNLKEYENILEPLGFLRTHHSFLVNPHKIIAYDKRDSGSLLLEGHHSIPVSQRKKDHILQLLESRS